MGSNGGKYFVGSIVEHGDMKYEVLEIVGRNHRKVKILNTGTILPKLHTWQLTTGEIKDPNKPNVYGVGYFGQGEFKCKIKGKETKSYSAWSGILERCYSDRYHESKRYKGRGVQICEEWLNYQNFAKWFNDKYIEGFQIDKDILGGKIYSPENCVFIPRELNTFFTNRHQERGEYPIGVCYSPTRDKYSASMNDGKGKTIYLKEYNTADEAFNVYKVEKEKLCKAYAEKYLEEGIIDSRVYDALMSWEVVKFPD